MTLDEALTIVERLPATADLDLHRAVAVRTLCRHLTDEEADTPADCRSRSAAPG